MAAALPARLWFPRGLPRGSPEPSSTGASRSSQPFSSQNKDEVKATIEKLGGKLTGTANKASLCISTKSKSHWPENQGDPIYLS